MAFPFAIFQDSAIVIADTGSGEFVADLYNFNFENANYDTFLTASGWHTQGTAPVLSTTQAHAGTKSLYISDASGYADTKIASPTAINEAEVYYSFWIYVTSYPPWSYRELITINTYSGGGNYEVYMNSDGTLELIIAYGSVGSTTTDIALNTWTQIKGHHKVNGASSVYEVKIGAETLTDNTNVAQTNIYAMNIGIGEVGPQTSYYIDDVKIDSSQYPT